MLDRLTKFFASLKLTVLCLALGLVLVFVGTMAQDPLGLYLVQERFFRSLFVDWASMAAALKKIFQMAGVYLPPSTAQQVLMAPRIPVFPGGYLIGVVLLINLITAYADRFKPSRDKSGLGLYLAHGGLILLLLGQFATESLQVESGMRLIEDQPKNYSESGSKTELAIVDTSDPRSDLVVAIPDRLLARGGEVRPPGLPFTLRVQKFLENSVLAQRGKNDPEPPAASAGFGPELKLRPAPVAAKMDERNMPAAVLEFLTTQGSLGTYVVSLGLSQPQTATAGGKTYTLMMRPVRYYKPFSLTLRKFSHDKYTGTDIPKNFSSRVRLQRPDTSEDREMLIYMNNPLRYDGETFYQASFDPNDPHVTILQVVRNPGWLTPYLACVLVGAGLLIQFMSHLFQFLKKPKTA